MSRNPATCSVNVRDSAPVAGAFTASVAWMNPSDSTVTLWRPAGRAIVNSPLWLVTATSAVVRPFVVVATCAPTIGAPVVSRTLPVKVNVVWATAVDGAEWIMRTVSSAISVRRSTGNLQDI